MSCRTRNTVGHAAADAAGSARQAIGTGVSAVQTTGAVATNATDHASQATSVGADAMSNPSGCGTTHEPGLQSHASNAARGIDDNSVDASGAATGNGNTLANGGLSSDKGSSAATHDQAGTNADAHGSARDGFSASVQANGGVNAYMQQH